VTDGPHCISCYINPLRCHLVPVVHLNNIPILFNSGEIPPQNPYY
jgi:hypothetical protein